MISRIRLFSTSSLRQLASSAASAESPASTLLQDATKKSSPSTWARRSLRLVSPFELRAAYPKQTMPALFAMRARLGLGDLDLETLKDLCSLESTKRDQYAEKGNTNGSLFDIEFIIIRQSEIG